MGGCSTRKKQGGFKGREAGGDDGGDDDDDEYDSMTCFCCLLDGVERKQVPEIFQNKPRCYPQQPRNLSRNLPGTRGSEPSPEPSRNPWFGSRPGTAPEPIVAKTP